MAGREIDPLTGTETTGHEWDGIKELNTPMPIWWLYTFYACILFALVWMVLFPAVPWLSGYTQGILGYSTRATHRADLADQAAARAAWTGKFADLDPAQIADNRELLQYAMSGGRILFADNCAPCHGTGGSGRAAYPILVDDDWIWGGTIDDIYQTIQYGIRNGHAEARDTVMPAFGTDGVLSADEINAVAEYVLSLSGAGPANARGAQIFAENCAACHGEDGKGIQEVGGPNLTDGIWLYGGSKAAIVSQITKPHLGVMPVWKGRLSDVEIKELAVYVHSLGGGQ